MTKSGESSKNSITSKPCPCHIGLSYEKCCKPFHIGEAIPSKALQLMRSRFSAYALELADYLIETTHVENPSYQNDHSRWRAEILAFSKSTHFEGLEIVEFIDGEHEAFVTFFARLSQSGQDVSLVEKSRFLKVGDRWIYHSGEVHIPS